jgi:hypothetical protein
VFLLIIIVIMTIFLYLMQRKVRDVI